MPRLLLKFILAVAVAVWAVLGAIISIPFGASAMGQPLTFAPWLLQLWRDHSVALVVALLVITVALGVIWFKVHAREDNTPTGGPRDVVHVSGGSGSANTTIGVSNAPVSVRHEHHGDRFLGDIYANRNDPRGLQPSIRAINNVLNVDDDGYVRSMTSTGEYTLAPRDENVARTRPLRLAVEGTTPEGGRLDAAIVQAHQQSAQQQEPVVINGAQLDSLRIYLDDRVLQEHSGEVQVIVEARPLGPPVLSVFEVPSTGARLEHLALELWPIGGRRFCLTNKNQEGTPLAFSIEFELPEIDPATIEQQEWIEAIGNHRLTLGLRPASHCVARQYLAFYAVLRSLRVERDFQIMDSATMTAHRGGRIKLDAPLDPQLEGFLDALQVVQDTFSREKLLVPEPIQPSDAQEVLQAAEIIRTGQLRVTMNEQGLSPQLMPVSEVTTLLDALPPDGVLRGLAPAVPTARQRTVLGCVLDLGPAKIKLCPVRIVESIADLRPAVEQQGTDEQVPVTFVPADANDRNCIFEYERFRRQASDAPQAS